MLRLALAAATLLAVPVSAYAQDAGGTPQRVRSVTITGDEKCPQGKGDEIVICTTVEDPYRIPKELRGSGPIPPQRQSWVNRVAADEQTSRVAAGLPNTCSVVGSGGATGCSQAAARAWAAARRAKANGQSED